MGRRWPSLGSDPAIQLGHSVIATGVLPSSAAPPELTSAATAPRRRRGHPEGDTK